MTDEGTTETEICHQSNTVRKETPCPRCGFKRKCKVSTSQRIKITYRVTPRSGYLLPLREEISREPDGPPGKSYTRLCTICDCIRRAEVHEDAAQKYRTKAQELLAKRNRT